MKWKEWTVTWKWRFGPFLYFKTILLWMIDWWCLRLGVLEWCCWGQQISTASDLAHHHAHQWIWTFGWVGTRDTLQFLDFIFTKFFKLILLNYTKAHSILLNFIFCFKMLSFVHMNLVELARIDMLFTLHPISNPSSYSLDYIKIEYHFRLH